MCSWASYFEEEIVTMCSSHISVDLSDTFHRAIKIHTAPLMLQIIPSASVHECLSSFSPWCSVPWSTETRPSRQSLHSTWRLWPQAATRPSASLTLRRSFHFSFTHSSLVPVSMSKLELSSLVELDLTWWLNVNSSTFLWSSGGWTSSLAWLHTLWGGSVELHIDFSGTRFSTLFSAVLIRCVYLSRLLRNVCQESMQVDH